MKITVTLKTEHDTLTKEFTSIHDAFRLVAELADMGLARVLLSVEPDPVEEPETFYTVRHAVGGLEEITSAKRCTCGAFVNGKNYVCFHMYDVREVPAQNLTMATRDDYQCTMDQRYGWAAIGPDGRKVQ